MGGQPLGVIVGVGLDPVLKQVAVVVPLVSHTTYTDQPVGNIVGGFHRPGLGGFAQAVAVGVVVVLEFQPTAVLGCRKPAERVVGIGDTRLHPLEIGAHHHPGQRAARQGAVVVRQAPVRLAVPIRAEVVAARRQHEAGLPISVSGRAAVEVVHSIEDIHHQPSPGHAQGVGHRHQHRQGGRDAGVGAARQGAVIFIGLSLALISFVTVTRVILHYLLWWYRLFSKCT